MKTVRILTCDSATEAALIQGRLENEGIQSFRTNENFATLMPHYSRILGSGVEILVSEDDAHKASVILEDIIKPTIPEQMSCPDCGSINVKYGLGKAGIGKLFFALISILTAVPINNIKPSYYCRNCSAEF